MPKVKTRIMNNSWLRQREIGQRFPLGYADRFSKRLYSSILPCTSWDHGENLRHAMHGGVFNLEFSPDGSLLVAACEKKSILMFDPLCRRLIHAVDNAHRDCVNCVRFLDSRVFATCSDDSTVALWDARNLKSQIRTLHGHSNWVKNIEFSPRDGLLVTSGFDGSIYTWDINSYTESGFVYNRVFQTNGLMRTRLNPDASKMIICTTGGYLIIIHNLDLTTMAQDLAGFKPNMYRLMQLSQTTIPVAADFTHLFSRQRKTNRVEFVTDFPSGDDAEVVSSLQIHPQGWCALSRNISNDELSEWTCVHDIQDREPSEGENESGCETDHEDDECSQGSDDKTSSGRPARRNVPESDSDSDTESFSRHRRIHRLQTAVTGLTSSLVIGPDSRARIVRPMVELRMDSIPTVQAAASSSSFAAAVVEGGAAARTSGAGRNDDGIPVDTRRRGTVGDIGRRGLSPANVELHVSSADVWEALVAIREARVRRERERERAERERSISMRIRANIEQRGGSQASVAVANGPASVERPGVVRIVVRRSNIEGAGGSVDISSSTGPSSSAAHHPGEGGSERGVRRRHQEGGPSEQGTEGSREAANGGSSENSASGSSLTNALAAVISATSAVMAATTSVMSTTTANQGTNTNSEREWNREGNVLRSLAPSGPTSSRTVLYIDNNAVHSSSTRGGYRLNSGSSYEIPRNQHIHQNVKRLTHYIEEPNVGKGFIKELCFSADGRLICSPFGYGVRLLAFSPECAELSTCVPPKPPVQLYELATNVCHADIVVSTKFSPQHCLLVSGCLSGKIVWHQPVV
ncbi:DDB1- and CUL4-associated factor 10 homolog [Periplaneta americana]|uniref:DDB1- and CUL4-associated factor 10 homolog n=1 Tax=Periplaneta americana TaxID=6978 RepID=UPI0037E97505